MNIQITKNYTLQGSNHSITILNFIHEYNNVTITNALRFQYKYNNIDRKLKTKSELDNLCLMLFNENKIPRHEIIDILLDYSPNFGRELTNRLREIERIERLEYENRINNIQNNKKIKNTIYSDSQNVHDKNINDSVKKSTIKLIEWYNNQDFENHILNIFQSFEEIKKYILNKNTNKIYFSKLTNALNRIETDISTFNINITLKELFIALFIYIQLHEYKTELENILFNELIESDGYCSTGYLARLINVLQGFTDDFEIKISDFDQCNAVVTNYLNKKLQENTDDEIYDGILTKSEKYINFIQNSIASNINIWKSEYGDTFIKNIDKVVAKFI